MSHVVRKRVTHLVATDLVLNLCISELSVKYHSCEFPMSARNLIREQAERQFMPKFSHSALHDLKLCDGFNLFKLSELIVFTEY